MVVAPHFAGEPLSVMTQSSQPPTASRRCQHSSQAQYICTICIIPFYVRVVVGEHDYTDPGDGQVTVTPSSWLSHPAYDPYTQDNDFALIKLATVLTFSRYILIL